MPNGDDDKTWVRLCGAINGFWSYYHKWPTKIRFFTGCIDELKRMLDPDEYEMLESKLEFVTDNSSFIAEDDEGSMYNYGTQGFPRYRPVISAVEWLGFVPRFYSEGFDGQEFTQYRDRR